MLTPGALIDPRPAVTTFLAAGGRAIAFDVFDTLLWRRTLFPADVFAMLPHGRLANAWRPCVEASVTAVCRRLLRREPRLSDIYRAYYPFDPAAELALETRLVVANPYCLSAMHSLVAQGVPVVAVSDMYLSGDQIGALLQSVGYPALPVLASSDAGISKRGGGLLFVRAVQQLGVSPGEVLHLGDDGHADVDMARHQGLVSQRVQAPRDTLFALCPELVGRRPRGPDSLFWGELAIALHGLPDIEARSPQVLASSLARLLGQPEARQQPPQLLAQAVIQLSESGQ